MSTPDLYLQTGYVLGDGGRILSTREPGAQRGPLFTIVRSDTRSSWAVRAGLSDHLTGELDRLAREEPPALNLRDPPVHADRYRSLVRGHLESARDTAVLREFSGPAFTFPEILSRPSDVVVIEDERLLQRNLHGWIPGEIAEGRARPRTD